MSDTNDVAAVVRRWLESAWVRSMRGWNHSVREKGVSVPQLGVLTRLFYAGGIGVHEIGRHMEATSAAASQFVDRLVNAGLVERTEDPEDRRVRRIGLTPRGRDLVERSLEDRFRWVEELTGLLSEPEREAVLKAIPALIDAERRMGPILEGNKSAAGPSLPARST
jgi:DNA-binding MarR family transcriptional regulator